MDTDKLVDLVPKVVSLARSAGREIMKVYATDFRVAHKGDYTPLTEADMASHSIILEGLSVLTPDMPVLSEESSGVPFEERSLWRYYWLVDPLDGTREFIKRNGEFTVNIALVEGNRSVLGVICAPAHDLCYFASNQKGAYKQVDDQDPSPIYVRSPCGQKPVVVGSRYYGQGMRTFLSKLGDYEFTSVGSSLKSCWVAEGVADIYPRFGTTSEWDTAASQCLVEEAGGRLTDIDLCPLRYNKPSLLNPYFLVFGDVHKDWSRLARDC